MSFRVIITEFTQRSVQIALNKISDQLTRVLARGDSAWWQPSKFRMPTSAPTNPEDGAFWADGTTITLWRDGSSWYRFTPFGDNAAGDIDDHIADVADPHVTIPAQAGKDGKYNLTTDGSSVSWAIPDHDLLTNYAADEHFTEASIDHDGITNTHNLTTDVDHDATTNTHNLSTDIDHAGLTNTHNLTTDIDHDALTNFEANEHFTEASIDHANITAGDGSDHADVATNTTHSGGDGSDHADVATNTAASHAEAHTVASHSDTTGTGAELDTLTDGSDASSLHNHDTDYTLEYMYPIYAVEAANLGSGGAAEWSFGHYEAGSYDYGVIIYVPSGWACTCVAMSLNLKQGTANVELLLNESRQGSDCDVTVSSGTSAVNDSFTPLAISDGDKMNFATVSSSGTATSNTVTAWFRMVKT